MENVGQEDWPITGERRIQTLTGGHRRISKRQQEKWARNYHKRVMSWRLKREGPRRRDEYSEV